MQLTPSDTLIAQFPPVEIQLIDAYNRKRNGMARGPKPDILLSANTMDRLSDIYEKEKKKVAQFHEEIDAKYSSDAIDIENMVSYMENVQYGFGHQNDEACFEVAKRNDLLYQAALDWMDVARDYRFLQRIVLHYRNLK